MAEENTNNKSNSNVGDVKAENVAKAIFENKKAQAATVGKSSLSNSGVIKFGKGLEIHPDKPLLHLSTPFAKAYQVENPENPNKKYFAMVANDILPPRTKSFKAFLNIIHKCSAELIGSGSVYWKPEEREKYVLIFDNIYGKPLIPDLTKKYKPMSEQSLTSKVIIPITGLLTAMKNAGYVHGAIRPNNLFENALDEGKTYALGQSLSTPLFSEQPILFETIERSMAQVSGRGLGTQDDDLYAFGVTLAYLLIGYNPLEKVSDQEIIKMKIENGSFSTIVGAHRLPQGMGEVFRGLLTDDFKSRWKVEDLQKWAEGRRSTPKPPILSSKASRTFEFMGERYLNPKLLVSAMVQNVNLASKIIEDESLHKWIERSFTNKEDSEHYENATYGMIRNVKGNELEELLVTRVAIALDPEGPIRYKGVSVMPTGLGTAITEAVLSQQSIEPYRSIIERQLINLWSSCQGDSVKMDMSSFLGQIDACKGFLKKTTPGNGFERCIYYLNREAPCLSPLFRGYYVHDPISFIHALESIAGQSQRPKEPFDQHMAAFLAVNFAATNEGDIQLLGAYDLSIRYKAILVLLASLQSYAEIRSLPHLASWMVTMLDPIVKNFHSRQLQKKVKQELESIAKEGNLIGMHELLQSRSLLKEDAVGFQKAMIEYHQLKTERLKLELDMARESYGLSQGRDVAATISVLFAMMGLGLFCLNYFGVF